MRLLLRTDTGELTLTKDLVGDENIPPYAILSHTWGSDDEEVTFADVTNGTGKHKAGYKKILFCGEQSQKDGLQYFWIDTCCINKANWTELAEAITSMFRWYRNATKCYVYLSDVSTRKRAHDQSVPKWESDFRSSRWFTRGWTLQELLAPKVVEFFSGEGDYLGDKTTLEHKIHETTGIPHAALRGAPLSDFSTDERMRWASKRATKKKEDRAYCLLGIFNVFIPLIYGEEDNAFNRLKDAINQPSKDSFRSWERLLESLNDDGSFTRPNDISKCSEGTFTWIFDDQPFDDQSFKNEISDSTSPKLQLRQWLQRSDGIFWIIGKPGSGKSTLMKFLAGIDNRNHQAIQCLETWARPRNPSILSFYFWLDDGSGAQNSFRGFLCHLLHQLLSMRSPDFISNLPIAEGYRKKRKMADWDLEELETLFKDVACRVAAETPLCFFIDGLDECKPADINHVIRVIGDLALRSNSRIKFCVSSRPEQKIHNRLGALAPQRLELHKLTEVDIRRYVTEQFESAWKSDFSPTKEQQGILINQLVWSAEGVFLWAFLVTKTLCEAIEFGDSIDQLQEQLRELPHDMSKLYDSMLGKSDATKGHRMAEAATYFKFVINHGERGILHYIPKRGAYLCYYSGLVNLVPFYEKYHGKTQPENLPSLLSTIRQRVNFLCAGMVVVEESSPRLRFFHRTARDFFREPSAREILQHCNLTELESYCLFVDVISRNRHSRCKYKLNLSEARQMIRWVKDMKESTDEDKVKILQHIDKTMSQVHAVNNGGLNVNWVYNQAKTDWSDDRVLDFFTLALQAGSTKLLSRSFSMNRSLGARYKDYLLLCSSEPWNDLPWTNKFLELGANPNARFYLGLQDRLKTSPWLDYLVRAKKWHDAEDDIHSSAHMDTISALLDSGASLEDRTVLLTRLAKDVFSSVHCRQLPLRARSADELIHGMILVIEVNAKRLLEQQCGPGHVGFDAFRTEILSRPDVQKAQSHRQVLLVHPGYTSDDLFPGTPSEDSEEVSLGESEELGVDLNNYGDAYDNSTVGSPGQLHPTSFAEIDLTDSETLLDELKLVPHTPRYGLPRVPEELYTRIREQILDIWQMSPKVPDFKQYLEDKGYYKKADDPAVPQGPIPMFEDEE